MNSILPEGDAIRKAVTWISGKLQENPNRAYEKLISDAVLQFDLSRRETEFLTEFYHSSETDNIHESH
ncbi:MAG: hypothetical protein ABFD82_09140 [Syntrophaceae bacterium]